MSEAAFLFGAAVLRARAQLVTDVVDADAVCEGPDSLLLVGRGASLHHLHAMLLPFRSQLLGVVGSLRDGAMGG